MINDIDEINVVIQDNDSISVNEGSVTDISEIVHNEEIRQANEAQRIINENERILNEGSREDYIADLKQQVEDGDFDGQDGISPVVTMEKQGKVTTLTITDATGTHTTEIKDGNDGSGTGDMLKATYDTNDNGVVDNAEKVNNHTVQSDVPANAKFTDTTYTAGTGIDITNNVISSTQTSAEWGNIGGDIDDQTDLSTALSGKQATIDSFHKLDADLIDDTTSTNKFFSGDYEDLANKPTIPDELADLSSDSTHRVVTDTEKTIWSGKQDALVSGTNIKTINNTSILGSGDIEVGADIPQQDTAPSNPQEDDLWIDTDDNTNLVNIDSTVSTTSTNPIENQAITNYVNTKLTKNYVDLMPYRNTTNTNNNGYIKLEIKNNRALLTMNIKLKVNLTQNSVYEIFTVPSEYKPADQLNVFGYTDSYATWGRFFVNATDGTANYKPLNASTSNVDWLKVQCLWDLD